MLPNYRMKLTRLRPSVFLGIDGPHCPGPIAHSRLGLQLMRGRYPAGIEALGRGVAARADLGGLSNRQQSLRVCGGYPE